MWFKMILVQQRLAHLSFIAWTNWAAGKYSSSGSSSWSTWPAGKYSGAASSSCSLCSAGMNLLNYSNSFESLNFIF